MVQGSVVAVSCDLETLLRDHGPGMRRGNSKRQAPGPVQNSSDLALEAVLNLSFLLFRMRLRHLPAWAVLQGS